MGRIIAAGGCRRMAARPRQQPLWPVRTLVPAWPSSESRVSRVLPPPVSAELPNLPMFVRIWRAYLRLSAVRLATRNGHLSEGDNRWLEGVDRPPHPYARGMAPKSRQRRPKSKMANRKRTRPPSGKGRALEELVARLEAVAAGGKAEVRSPEFFTGRRSQGRREVDVTVRSRVGSTTVLVMFECRDRAKTNDVRWIDEIAGKRDDIGADVAVAVAAGGGFSEAAKTAAAAHRIDLRTVEEITVDDVVSWCRLTSLRVELFESREPRIEVALFGDTPPIELSTQSTGTPGAVDVPLDQPIFTLWDARNVSPPEDPHWVTAMEIHALGMEAYREVEGLPRFSEWTAVAMLMSTAEAPTVAVKTPEGPFPLSGFKAIAEVRVTESDVPITLRSVTHSDGETTQVVEAVAELGDMMCTVSFIKTRDGISILTAPEGASPDTAGAVSVILNDGDDINWNLA